MSVNAATTVSTSPLATSRSSCALSNLPGIPGTRPSCPAAPAPLRSAQPQLVVPEARSGKKGARAMAFLFGKLAFVVLRPSSLLLLLALVGVLGLVLGRSWGRRLVIASVAAMALCTLLP